MILKGATSAPLSLYFAGHYFMAGFVATFDQAATLLPLVPIVPLSYSIGSPLRPFD
jgi:hypothetical protein